MLFWNYELVEGEESFLKKRFIDEDDTDDNHELESGCDNNETKNKDNLNKVEQEIEQIVEKDINMENIVKKQHQLNPKILQQFKGNKSEKILIMF